MKSKLKYLLLLLCLIPYVAFGWNFTGHVIIAQIAYDNLSPAAKQRADQYANLIYCQLSETQKDKMDRQFTNASTFAKVAELPDVWRKWHFGTILQKFNAPVPLSMLLDADDPTESWHFINLPYPLNSHCSSGNSENVVWAIQNLKTAYPKSTNSNSQAVIMVLEEHYIGDIHQPLHTISRIDSTCKNDEGGNDFCIRYGKNGTCTKNLHSLWDSAVGFIKPHANIEATALDLEQLYPKSEFVKELDDTNPMDWAKANLADADFIYSLPEGQKPPPAYYQEGQLIAKKQLALAGYRLANVLNQELTQDQ